VNVLDTTDPKSKSRPSFIEDSLTNADEIHVTHIKYFFQRIA
jgi:hypothetical protein